MIHPEGSKGRANVERIWHMQDIQGNFLVQVFDFFEVVFQEQVFDLFEVVAASLGSGTTGGLSSSTRALSVFLSLSLYLSLSLSHSLSLSLSSICVYIYVHVYISIYLSINQSIYEGVSQMRCPR